MVERKTGKPEKKKKTAPRRGPGPKDAELPSPQRPVRQAKNPKQPPREEEAAADRPHPGRHHSPRDGL